jgi:hypothetical protein
MHMAADAVLLKNLIFESDAFQVVFLEPGLRDFNAREHLEVIDVAVYHPKDPRYDRSAKALSIRYLYRIAMTAGFVSNPAASAAIEASGPGPLPIAHRRDGWLVPMAGHQRLSCRSPCRRNLARDRRPHQAMDPC